MATYKILTLGDSNTAGAIVGIEAWPTLIDALLEAAYTADDFTIVNEAVGATDSGDIASGISGWLSEHSPDIVCVMTGTNDVGGWHNSNIPWQTLAQTEANIEAVISACATAGADVVLVQPPPAVSKTVYDADQTDLAYWRARDTGECSNNLQSIKTLVTNLGAEYGCAVASVWDEIDAAGYDGSETNKTTQETWLYDGVHITDAAQELIAELVTETLAELLAQASGTASSTSSATGTASEVAPVSGTALSTSEATGDVSEATGWYDLAAEVIEALPGVASVSGTAQSTSSATGAVTAVSGWYDLAALFEAAFTGWPVSIGLESSHPTYADLSAGDTPARLSSENEATLRIGGY